MINIFLVVIATQFSETKRRETERMAAERRRGLHSNSSLNRSSISKPGSCWEEFLREIMLFISKTLTKMSNYYRNAKRNPSKNVKSILF